LKTRHIAVKHPDKIKFLSTLFGAGFLTVTQYLEAADHPYSGQVALEHGSIAEDLAHYFLVSEQIPTGFKLSVFFDDEEQVRGAGGIFLQAMPGVDPGRVAEAEKIIQGIDSLGELFATGHTPEAVIQQIFSSLEPKMLHSNRVEFFCRCTQEKMAGYLKSLPANERSDMIKTGPFPVEIRCHHCNSGYVFTKQDLIALGM
jgi:molecular chaperone Hsp33